MQITTSWHEKGRVEGRLEGRVEGLIEGRAEGQAQLVLRLLKKLFGEAPADVEEKIKAMGPERIERLGEALLDVKTIEELKPLLH